MLVLQYRNQTQADDDVIHWQKNAFLGPLKRDSTPRNTETVDKYTMVNVSGGAQSNTRIAYK